MPADNLARLLLGDLATPSEIEEANRLIDLYRDSSQDWKDGAASQGHTFAENYNAGRISIVCNLDVSVAYQECRGRCTTLNDKPVRHVDFSAALIFRADVPDNIKSRFGNQQFVFVDVVQVVELPQEITIPTLVRLYDLPDEVNDIGSSLLFQSTIDGSYKFLSCFTNGKLAELVSVSDAVQGVIQGRAHVVEGIANNEQNVVGNGAGALDVKGIAHAVRVTIDDNRVFAVPAEFADCRIKIRDVLIGPL